MKKSFLPPSTHKTRKCFASLELILALVLMGVAFKIFWEIYGQSMQQIALNQKTQALSIAQKNIHNQLSALSTQGGGIPFSVISQKGFHYEGVWVEEHTQAGSYHYFSPKKISTYESSTN
ncbi:hypothetical protein BKH46_07905 [Helicobacter sp. 12S02634-8]|uniref:hypothetical protein n=1 Tax=Helicobacter sp. 12S02634-8 TaxID=1476199 RepID=UPI000BA647BD|nr:hypothetical protein [Helicobacter sp. 12S02634-8]PAF46383.1 hypothetical protein BKH46_07905 [Helicobacter sp. 12S02634-8]